MRRSTKSLLGIYGAYTRSSVQNQVLSPVFLHALFPHMIRAGSSGHFLSSSLACKTVASSKEQDSFGLQGQCIKQKTIGQVQGQVCSFVLLGGFKANKQIHRTAYSRR